MTAEKLKHHLVFDFPGETLKDETLLPGWFRQHYWQTFSLFLTVPDLRVTRMLITSMLREAWNQNEFLGENPEADEVDRMYMITWLQMLASYNGLLTYEEIEKIRDSEGKFQPINQLETPVLQNFDATAKQASAWSNDGLVVGLFQGSFDPPTLSHLRDATLATEFCHRLVIGYDNDDLLRARKGAERPRYKLQWRRNVFGSFWMVDSTIVLRPKTLTGLDNQYEKDYQDLRISRLFTVADDPAIDLKRIRIEKLGGELVILDEPFGKFHSSSLVERLKINPYLDILLP